MRITQDPWAAPAAPAPHPQTDTLGRNLAIASIVIGVISLPAILCCSCIGAPIPLLGLGLGGYAWYDAKSKNQDAMLGIVGTAINGLSFVMMVGFMVFALAVNNEPFENLLEQPSAFEEIEEFETDPVEPAIPTLPETTP